MARITVQEKKDFHILLDKSLSKLDSEKNIKKVHWSELSIRKLQKMLVVESCELDVALCDNNYSDILSECDDIINFAMFIKHNIMLMDEI